ncbi:MAG TPA: alanine racemase, partial [Thermoanaerobaculia bacterium]|nr:alanine racemase [Thermoanaerobaculia bacterium]
MADGDVRDLAALRPAWLTVDLDALRANLELLGRHVSPARRMAVVKANAYGHGAAEISRALAAGGVEWLAVALVEEGAEVRRAGVTTPILVLGTVQPPQVPLVRKFGLVPAVASASQLAIWVEAAAGGAKPLDIHLKVDTGMSRLGIPPEELAAALEVVRRTPHLRLAGLMSH